MKTISLLPLLALAACAQPASLAPPAPAPATLPEPLLALDPPEGIDAFLDCLREGQLTIVSAHRGGPLDGYPENAVETMANVSAQAPVMLEIDVRQTADGHYVLFHDDDLDQDTDGTGPLAERTLTELEAVRYNGTDIGISTLAEALEWADGRALLQLDVKRGVAFEPLIDWLEARGADRYSLIITYSVEDAARVARASETFLISASVNDADDLDALNAAGVPSDRISAWTGLRSPDIALWQMLGEAGVSANYGAYATLDEQDGSAEAYATLKDRGLDILSSDRPVFAYEALEARQDFTAAARSCMAR